MDRALKAIERLKKMNLSDSKYEHVLKLVSQITYPAFYFTLEAGKSIYRARSHQENEMFYFEKDLSYRTDINNINKHNRANPAYSTMFYGSISTYSVKDGYLISASETSELCRNKKNGIDTLTIGKWVLKRSMKALIVLDAINYKFHSQEIDDMYKAYMEFINSQDNPEDVKLISTFLANEFGKNVKTGEDYEYMISAAFSELFFAKGLGYNAIIYPSVKSNGQGYNIVLLPYVADDNLILDRVLLAQLHKTGEVINFPQFKIANLTYPFQKQPFNYNDLDIKFKLGFKYPLPNLII